MNLQVIITTVIDESPEGQEVTLIMFESEGKAVQKATFDQNSPEGALLIEFVARAMSKYVKEESLA